MIEAFRKQVYYALERPSQGNSLAKVFGASIFVLIILNAVLIFVEPQSTSAYSTHDSFWMISLVSSAIFAVEYLFRIWVSDLIRPSLSPVRARAHYIFSPMGIIDLLAWLPGLVSFVVPLPALADSVLVLRLIRLIKLTRYMRGLHMIGRVLVKRRYEIIASTLVLFLLAIISSVLMYQVEHEVQPESFTSVFSGLYWAMTTITSTGYGDIVPVTTAGKTIGFFTMFLSIAVVAIPGGVFSAGFVAEMQAKDRAMEAFEGHSGGKHPFLDSLNDEERYYLRLEQVAESNPEVKERLKRALEYYESVRRREEEELENELSSSDLSSSDESANQSRDNDEDRPN